MEDLGQIIEKFSFEEELAILFTLVNPGSSREPAPKVFSDPLLSSFFLFLE